MVSVLQAADHHHGGGAIQPMGWPEGEVGGNTDASRVQAAESGTGRVVELILPWPPSELSPNARNHWAKLAKAKREYRAACSWAALQQGARAIQGAKALHVTLTFHAPTRRAYDLDNALARMKSGLDGLADVLYVDDSKWSLTIKKAAIVGGFVRVEVAHA